MKRVFIDTGGFFAHLVSEDPLHARAAALFAQAHREAWALVSTNAVLYETHALLVNRTREGREAGLRFIEHVESGLCVVVRVTPDDEASATSILRDHQDKAYSLCDALSFVVTERLGITEAVAFDRHFREYGKLTIL